MWNERKLNRINDTVFLLQKKSHKIVTFIILIILPCTNHILIYSFITLWLSHSFFLGRFFGRNYFLSNPAKPNAIIFAVKSSEIETPCPLNQCA